MARSTFLELCKAGRRATGITGTGPTTVLNNTGDYEKLVEWVALADQELQSRWFDWDFLHVSTWSTATIIGVPSVIAPSDIGSWDTDSFYLNYTLPTGTKLTSMDYKEWRKTMRQGTQTNQRPTIAVVKPDLSLILQSPPDAVYSLTADYWKRPVKMMYAEDGGSMVLLQAAQIEYDDLLDKLEAKYLPSQRNMKRMSDAGMLVVRPE
jgi:hypothetical protein